MLSKNPPRTVLDDWKTILGEPVELGERAVGRDVWPVTAADGAQYLLKRLSPWRNLPLADESRILRHVAVQGVPVAEFLPTDWARLYAGELEEPCVLMPRLASDPFTAAELFSLEETVGSAPAHLHLALATYPWPANSYTETLSVALEQDLMLPPISPKGSPENAQVWAPYWLTYLSS